MIAASYCIILGLLQVVVTVTVVCRPARSALFPFSAWSRCSDEGALGFCNSYRIMVISARSFLFRVISMEDNAISAILLDACANTASISQVCEWPFICAHLELPGVLWWQGAFSLEGFVHSIGRGHRSSPRWIRSYAIEGLAADTNNLTAIFIDYILI